MDEIEKRGWVLGEILINVNIHDIQFSEVYTIRKQDDDDGN